MRPMRSMITLLATATLALSGLGRAEAAYVNFTFLGAGISGAGVLTVQANATGGGYSALSGTMDVFGDTAVRTANLAGTPNTTGTSYAPGVPTYFGAYDDQIFPSVTTAYVDINGLFFSIGVNDIFLFSYGPSQYAYLDYNTKTGAYFQPTGLQVVLSAVQSGSPPVIPSLPATVPEPSSLVLCGIAACGSLGIARVRRRRLAA